MGLFRFLPKQNLAVVNFFRSRSISSNVIMNKLIQLTEKEATLRQLLLDVSDYIASQSHTKPDLRFSGGWVRDKLLGSTSKDIDISISSMTGYNFGLLMKAFLESSGEHAKYDRHIVGGLAKIEANPEKSKHLETVTTKILDLDIDIVNLRKEKYSDDSRNPIMEFGTPEEDANRRDATVNALFYNLQTSEVEDFTGRGLQDMERKVIKTPLSPYQTFKDDPLRILRAIRFASRLGYRIDSTDEQAMSDESIKDALRLKISRERVGIEVVKMLQGPSPHTALSLIDRLNLYSTIFTNPNNDASEVVNTEKWHLAYDQLLTLTTTEVIDVKIRGSLQIIATVLLIEPKEAEEVYLAWMLCCFVPWARIALPTRKVSASKYSRSAAGAAAREGIKAERKLTAIIDEAVLNLSDVITTKDAIVDQPDLFSSLPKREQTFLSRELHGKAMLRWGRHWRSTVVFALLVQVVETQNQSERQAVLDSYASWLSNLAKMDLLNVHEMKPIVDGKQVSKALNVKSGPWMKKALDIAMAWQLRNPDESSPKGCIDEIIQRKKEFEFASPP